MRILVIEDDAMIGKSVRLWLSNAGFSVDWVQDGQAGSLAVETGVYDLVLLDLSLPRRSGVEILRALRARHNNIPVLVATARDAVADRVAGLNAGADDYLVKPFDLDELVARIRALLRRHAGSGSPLLEYRGLVVDPICKTVRRDGREVLLSPREFSLLEALMQKPGAVVSRNALQEAIYGWGEELASNAIEVHLYHLRRKLGAEVIKNVRGVGYRVAGG